MFRFLPEQDGDHRGMDVEIVTDRGTVPLTYRKAGIEYGAELTDSHGKITARTDTTAAAMTVTVPDGERGELRTVTVSTSDKGGLRGEIRVSFAPVLARWADYEAHPMFSKLSLETWVNDNTMIIRRRPRGNEGEAYMAIAADRNAVFTDEGDRMKRYTTIMDSAARVPIEIRGEGSATVKVAVCAGRTEQEVKSGTARILKSSEPRLPMCGKLRTELGLTTRQAAEAMDCLTQLVYVTPERRARQDAVYGRDSLWSMGLSGDLPILAENVSGPDQAVDAVKRYCYLTECGFRFELALITEDGGDYLMPTGRAIGEYLRSVNREYRAAEVRFIDKNSDHAASLIALADCWRAE
jgi:cyclic beta-1,2-glucan synthetase